MAAHKRPTPGSLRPIAARIKTVSTNALEIGFTSEIHREKEPRLVEKLTTDPHGTCSPKQDPDHQPKQIDSLPVRGLRGSKAFVLRPLDDLNQDQANIDDGRTKDRAQRDDEADFAVRVVWTEPADSDEIRPEPGPE